MKYLIFLCPICLLNNFLSFQLFVFSALWTSQPFELPSFLVSKLFGPPKMSLVLQPPGAWLLILRTGVVCETTVCKESFLEREFAKKVFRIDSFQKRLSGTTVWEKKTFWNGGLQDLDLVDLLTIKIYPTEGGREDHYFGAETQGFQGLVDRNDQGKA